MSGFLEIAAGLMALLLLVYLFAVLLFPEWLS
jgi:K+-transporting ATPase KdpF subunit